MPVVDDIEKGHWAVLIVAITWGLSAAMLAGVLLQFGPDLRSHYRSHP